MPYNPEYHRNYYLKNKEKFREYGRLWAKNNPDKVKKSSTLARQKRKESGKDKVTRTRWEEQNREYILWNAAKQRAKRNNLEFNISVEDISIPDVCPYLGIPIHISSGSGRMKPNSPSLDRIDNSKGYVLGNIQVISWKANRIKSDTSILDLIAFSEKVLELHKK